MTAISPLPPSTLTPQTTLRDIINTLPRQCFAKDPFRAWLGVFTSLFAAILGYLAIASCPWYLLPLAWLWTGTALTGWFVIGHDCGHRSFYAELQELKSDTELLFQQLQSLSRQRMAQSGMVQ